MAALRSFYPPRASAADADELGAVLDLGEPVVPGHRAGPAVQLAVADLLDAAARAARQVVVVPAAAEHERQLAVLASQRVGGAFVGQPLEVAVDGCEAHAVELAVQLLRRDGSIGFAQRIEDRLALLGLAAHERKR